MAPFLKAYWKQCRKGLGIFLLFSLIFLGVFLLYGIPMEAVLYPAILCGLLGAAVFGPGCASGLAHLPAAGNFKDAAGAPDGALSRSRTPLEAAEYQEIDPDFCGRGRSSWKAAWPLRYEEMVEYYTIWAHQIKTPIASMRLTLQNEDSELSRRLSEDLLRIEQYVEMVLCYLRLDSSFHGLCVPGIRFRQHCQAGRAEICRAVVELQYILDREEQKEKSRRTEPS